MSFFTSCFLHYYHHNPGCKEKPYSNLNYLKLTPKHSFTSSFYLFRADRKNIMSFLVRDTLTYDDQQFHVNIIRKMCCAYVDKPKLLVFQVPCSKRFFFGCSVFPFLNQHFQVAFHPGILTEVEEEEPFCGLATITLLFIHLYL